MHGSDSNEASNYEIVLSDPSNTTFYKSFRYTNNQCNASTLLVAGVGGAMWNSTTAITGVRFYFDSGNIESGQFDLIGLS